LGAGGVFAVRMSRRHQGCWLDLNDSDDREPQRGHGAIVNDVDDAIE
jgi:hypothetical protein